MLSNSAAYYLWPTVWVGAQPPSSDADIDVKALGDEVYRKSLSISITVKVLREGMFVFDFSNWAPGRALPEDPPAAFDDTAGVTLKRTMVMNAHLACLYTALTRHQHRTLDKMVLSPADLITMKSLDDAGMGFGDLRVAALALARYPSTYASLPIADWRVGMRTLVIEKATIEDSFQRLDGILTHPASHALLLTDLHLRSSKAYEDHNYSLSLVTAWATIEKLLQVLWERHIEEHRRRKVYGEEVIFINSERKRKLTESRDFTASVISEILSLSDKLPFRLYQQIARVRQARNDWIHGLQPVTRADAEHAVKVSEEMLRLTEHIDLELALVSRLHG